MKLPNKYGSVYKLSGKRRNPWAARKTVGWKQIPEKKKSYPVYKFIGYYATRAEALQALASYNEDPYDLHLDTITFAEVYEKWSAIHYETIKDCNGYKAAFASFGSVLTVIVGCLASGSVSLIVIILVIIIAWNYLKLLFEAAERYIMVGVLIFTAPVAFATGASESTSNIFSSWCRMLGGQLFLLIMNAWCLRLFVSMVGTFLANPLSV